MAGHLAGVYVNRKTGLGAAALTNSGTRGEHGPVRDRARQGGSRALAAERSSRGSPSRSRRRTSAPLLGRWWSEGNEFLFWWEGGSLRAKFAAAPPGKGETSSSATATAGAPPPAASAASACGSTATR